MSESTRLLEQRLAMERANAQEIADYTAAAVERQSERWDELRAWEVTEKRSTYRPDETDDQWTRDWEDGFEQSAREWERFA